MHRSIHPSTGHVARAAGLLVLLAGLVGSTGCNAPGPRSQDVPELGYFAARGADFLDMFELNVGAGAGLHVAAEVAPIRVSYGHYEGSKFGLMGRSAGTWDETRSELFVGLHQLLHWEKEPCWGNGFLFTLEETPRHSATPTPQDYSRESFYEEWGWVTRYEDHEKAWMDVGAEVFIFCVGVEVGFSPHELCDFVLGIFTVDAVSHDDHASVPADVDEGE